MVSTFKENKVFVLVACAAIAALVAGALAVGCSKAASIEGVWHFASMAPSEASLADADEGVKADLQSQSDMLAVFMSDAQAEFKEGGEFVFTFLGQAYNGTWEADGKTAHVKMNDGEYTSASGTYTVDGDKLVFECDSADGRLSGFTVLYESGPAEGAVIVDDSQMADASQDGDVQVIEEDVAVDEQTADVDVMADDEVVLEETPVVDSEEVVGEFVEEQTVEGEYVSEETVDEGVEQ